MARLFGISGGQMLNKSWKRADFQENTFLSQEKVNKAVSFEITDDMKNFFQLPKIDSSLHDLKNFVRHG